MKNLLAAAWAGLAALFYSRTAQANIKPVVKPTAHPTPEPPPTVTEPVGEFNSQLDNALRDVNLPFIEPVTAGNTALKQNEKHIPLGIRNNNPGNIRATATIWRGQKGSNRGFIVFETPEYGIRALTVLLRNYYFKHDLKTIAQIIRRYAPSNENNTQSYINSVALRTGYSATQVLPWPEALPALIYAIIKHENGIQPYDTETIMAGIRKAGEFA